MKHAITTAIAVAAGLGLATAAQATGLQHQSAMPGASTQAAATGQMRTAQHLSRPEMIRQAQQQLKADGLYRGRVNGVLNHATRVALGKFQRQHGLRGTDRLDQTTFAQLMGGKQNLGTNQNIGVGSSTPSSITPSSGGSSNTAPMTPPATQTPGAGNSQQNTGTAPKY